KSLLSAPARFGAPPSGFGLFRRRCPKPACCTPRTTPHFRTTPATAIGPAQGSLSPPSPSHALPTWACLVCRPGGHGPEGAVRRECRPAHGGRGGDALGLREPRRPGRVRAFLERATAPRPRRQLPAVPR